MNWRQYQKYLSDGGWELVTTQGREIKELRIQCDDIEDRLEQLEAQQPDWSVRVLAVVCAVALCIIFLLIMTGVP